MTFASMQRHILKMLESMKNNSSHPDVWCDMEDPLSNGWFLPSLDELVAFLTEMNVTDENYESKDLSGFYWTSSGGPGTTAIEMRIQYGGEFAVYAESMSENLSSIRLSKTF